jgi:hypothetical protein
VGLFSPRPQGGAETVKAAMAHYTFEPQADGTILVQGGERDHTITGSECSCASFVYRTHPAPCKHLAELARRREHYDTVTRPALKALRAEVYAYVSAIDARVLAPPAPSSASAAADPARTVTKYNPTTRGDITASVVAKWKAARERLAHSS